MTLIWLYGLIFISAAFLIGTWAGVAWRNRHPLRPSNVVLATSFGVAGLALFLMWTTGLRILETILMGGSFDSSMPLLFQSGLMGMVVSLVALVWAASLRREDFNRLDSPTTIAPGWRVYLKLMLAWSILSIAGALIF